MGTGKEYMHWIDALNDDESCANCDSMEDGGHYCLLHTKQVKNANIVRCPCWTPQRKADDVPNAPGERRGIPRQLDPIVGSSSEDTE